MRAFLKNFAAHFAAALIPIGIAIGTATLFVLFGADLCVAPQAVFRILGVVFMLVTALIVVLCVHDGVPFAYRNLRAAVTGRRHYSSYCACYYPSSLTCDDNGRFLGL